MASHAAAPERFDLARAFKDAALAAIIAAGLAFPILALRAEPDIDNRLTLQGRWSWLFIAAGDRSRPLSAGAVRHQAAPQAGNRRGAPCIGLSRGALHHPAGLALLFVFPLAVLVMLGPQGA